jgi:peroxiredoxin
VGSPAPSFKLEGMYGETMTLDALRAQGKPLLLLFTDPGCGPCNALLPDIARWQKELASVLTVGLISSGTAERNKAKAAEHGISQIMLQENRSVSSQFKAHGTPSAVMVTPDGLIDSPVAAGSEAIRQLVAKVTGSPAPQPAARTPRQPAAPAAAPAAPANAPAARANAPVKDAPLNVAAPKPQGGNGAAAAAPAAAVAAKGSGQPAPEVSLPDLSGNTVNLSDFKGSPTMVLFWNPGCGFCRKMADELKEWEANPPAGAPKLLIVSTGTVEANQALGLSSPTVLDEGFQTGRAFGASGTPSAVLVDAEGRIASAVSVGGPNVMAMARGEQAPPPAPAQPSAPQPAVARGSGEPAPEIKLPDLTGKTVSLKDFKGSNTMVLFWNPGCGFCRKMADELKEWEASPPKGAPRLLIVSTGTVEANQALGLSSTTVLDEGFTVGRAFGASGTPSAVLVDAKGRLASAVSVGGPNVMAMARGEKPPAAPAARPAAPPTKKGEKAPDISLKDLDGQQFSLADQAGKQTMLLFWNPGCGFCKRMVDDLNGWVSSRPAGTPEVVLVSTGTEQANRDMGISARTLLDEGFSTGRQFGAGGTPSAILIDESGKIASDVAVGAQAVLSLAGAPQPAAT